MYRTHGVAMAATLLASTAHAGGVERATFSTSILFEEGTYSELSFGYISPSVSGTAFAGLGGADSGNVLRDYIQWAVGFKTDISEKLSVAFILDQPIGASTAYPAGTGYPAAGFEAQLDNLGLTALAKYELPSNFSVYGGVRALQTSGDVDLAGGYILDTSTELDFGYIVGAAWERPEIAARVALTYISAITQDFDSAETTAFGTVDSTFRTTIPQTVKLEAQTGVAEDTLLFGSIQWTEWTAFNITPDVYTAVVDPGNALVDYQSDVFTYSLGVGRRFSEQWSGAVIGTFEPSNGNQSGNLGPTDGFTRLALAATYAVNERVEIDGGLSYTFIGDTFTRFGDFEDNSAIAAGLRVGIRY